MEVDVAIVGAGPAGSALAAILAARGRSVALIERDTFPRDKLCGEFLSYDALPIADALGVDLSETPEITRCRIVSRSRTLEFEFPHAARGVSRCFLDERLFRNAARCGAQPLEGATVTNVSTNLVTVGDREVRARVVVGAWGRWGRFDTQLDRAFVRDHAHRHFGFKRHYRNLQPASDRTAIELHSFDRGYLGVSAIEDGQTNICGLVHESQLAGHKGRWDAFVERIRIEEKTVGAMYDRHEPSQDGFLSSEPVIFRARSPIEKGMFMIGDASGIVDPLTGNGMAMALQSAVLVAPFILDAIDGKRREDEYRARHHQFFAPRIAWSRYAARILSRPALLDAMMHVLPGKSVAKFLLRRTRADREAVLRLLSSCLDRP